MVSLRNIFIIIIFIPLNILTSNHIFAQNNFDITTVKNTGLTLVEITTENGVMPTCDFMEAPEGSMGVTCINQNKVPCRIIISKQNNILFDSGEYEKNVSGATIKIVGNTSALYDNKPYKIKLQSKADLLFRNNEKYKDKDWRLLKDAKTLNTIIGLKVNELLGLPWTPAYKPCNVFINNEYQGCYLLIESVERNSDCRLNVDKYSGYIIERDAYWWNETKYFSSQFFDNYLYYRWTWKYPDDDNVSFQQQQYIQNYINLTEQSIKDGNYDKYIDVNSFAKWILAHDILGTWESGCSNLYVMKYDDTDNSLLEMANLWDFDTIFGMAENEFSRYHNGSNDFYYYDLFNSSNSLFRKEYITLWNSIKPTLLTEISVFLNTYIESEESQALQLSRDIHKNKWNCKMNTVSEDATSAIEWFNRHIPLLDEKINQISTSIIQYQYTNNKNSNIIINLSGLKSNKIYDLNGRRVTAPHKGIYIKNNKKYSY